MYNSPNTAIRIKETAKIKNIKLKQMLEDLGLGINTISHMAKGQTLSSDSLYAIADYLEVSTDYLLCRIDEPNGYSSIKNSNNNNTFIAENNKDSFNNNSFSKPVPLDKRTEELMQSIQSLSLRNFVKVCDFVEEMKKEE